MDKNQKDSSLIAVVLGDSYTTTLRPLTYRYPKALLPLLNIPILEYVMEYLQWQGITQCYVLYSQGISQVKNYLTENRWTQDHGSMKVETVEVPTSCRCTGDSLRFLDSKHLIKQNFVLISGDTITNMNLQKAIDFHSAQKQAYSNALMTIVMKRSKQPTLNRIMNSESALTTGIDTITKQLFYYQYEPDFIEVSRDPTFNESQIFNRVNSEINCQLTDVQIYICSPEVLAQLTEHFDHRQLRRDFIPGILNEEMLGYKLFTYELDERQNAQRIRNYRSYLQVAMSMLQRWFYPIVPDNNMFQANGVKALYSYKINNIYLEQGEQIQGQTHSPSRSPLFKAKVDLKKDVCMGVGTEVEEFTVISSSVIGRDCKIGSNCLIERSLIMDNVKIENNCIITGSVIASDVHIHHHSIIKKGSVISYDINLQQKVVEPHSIFQLEKDIVQEEEDDREFPIYEENQDSSLEESQENVLVSPSYRNSSKVHKQSFLDPSEHFREKLLSGPQLPILSTENRQFIKQDFQTKINEIHQSNPVKAQRSPGQNKSNVNQQAKNLSNASANVENSGAKSSEQYNKQQSPQEEEMTTFRREILETLLKSELEGSFDMANQEISIHKVCYQVQPYDCAKYIVVAAFQQAFAPPNSLPGEYRSLFLNPAPDLSSENGLVQFDHKIVVRLRKYQDVIKKFVIRGISDYKEILYGVQDFILGVGEFLEFANLQSKSLRENPFAIKLMLQALYNELEVPEQAFREWQKTLQDGDEQDLFMAHYSESFFDWLEEDDESDEAGNDEESDQE